MRRPVQRVCAQCERIYESRMKVSKFCSRECSLKVTGLSSERVSGKANPRYNGGLSANPDGRTIVVFRDGGHMLMSRAMMCAEVGRLLERDEVVHHINGDPLDDRLENLQVLSRSDHMRLHYPELRAAQDAAFAARKRA